MTWLIIFLTPTRMVCFIAIISLKAVVPDGVCITTIAMKKHIDENDELMNCLNETVKMAKEVNFELLSKHCKR